MASRFILLLALSSVNGISFRYTAESFTTENEPCMSDCVDYRCVTGWSGNVSPCFPGTEPGHQYFTAMKHNKEPLCLSKCGRFGEQYDWCFVKDGTFNWDYCSSKTERESVTHYFTNSYGPCKDECAKRNEDYNWCSTFWSSQNWDYCDNSQTVTYIQSYTRKGVKCIGHCKMMGTADYNWCKHEGGDGWDFCAAPAQSVYHQRQSCHLTCDARSKRADDVDALNGECVRRPGLIRDLAFSWAHQPGFLTMPVNEPNNSVTSYTVRLPRNPREPQLPIVVRARIDLDNIPPRGSSANRTRIPSFIYTNLNRMGMHTGDPENNNDEAGHLIGYQNGGPFELYNFAPQTRRLNRSTNDSVTAPSIWFQDEGFINQWVRNGGIVDEVVIVLYRDINTQFRPAGFGTSIRYLNADGTLNNTCPDYFFSNDPSFY